MDGLTYLWEVKPVHYGLNPKLEQEALEEQLAGYVNSNETYYRYGPDSGVVFEKDSFPSKEGLFTITYEDAGNGLVLYRFDLNRRNRDDDDDNKASVADKKDDDDDEDHGSGKEPIELPTKKPEEEEGEENRPAASVPGHLANAFGSNAYNKASSN